MSNLGKQYIQIPKGVHIEIKEASIVVKGNLGSLEKPIPKELFLIHSQDRIHVLPMNLMEQHASHKKSLSWGSVRTMIYNMIKGVHQGFHRKLQLVGIGYKVFLIKKRWLHFKLGFSHQIYIKLPPIISVTLLKPTLLHMHSMDYELLTQTAATLRDLRKPEPYKGKGIRYTHESVRRKEGKKS